MAHRHDNLESPGVAQHAEEVIQSKPTSNWKSYVWDTLDKSPEERKFLFKLDSAVLTFATLGYFIKYLDQSNVNNAFVSGMQKDLGLYGNQLNYMQSSWTAGYVIGQIPSNLILSRVRPSIWIPTLELVWTILTFCLSQCNTAEQLYGLRFLVGLAESGFYPGMQFLIGSWYRRDELAKRSCIFHTASAIATMFSGYLMAAVYNLDGVGGLAGWKWLFIMDGVISLPIALLGYVCLPDLPENTRSWYFTAEERAFGQKRMELEGRRGKQPYTRAKLKKIFSSWHIYMLTLCYVTFNNNALGQPIFLQYLHYHKNPVYKTWQVNVYPTSTFAVQVVTTLVYAWSSDTIFEGRRWPPIIFGACMNIFCYVNLAVWNIPDGLKWACFILAGCGGGLSGMIFAWTAEICSDDREERALVSATINEMAYVVQAWLPLIVWQQVDAPRYHKGYITSSCISASLIIFTFTTRWLQKRETASKRLQQEHIARSDTSSSVEADLEINIPKDKAT